MSKEGSDRYDLVNQTVKAFEILGAVGVSILIVALLIPWAVHFLDILTVWLHNLSGILSG